MPVYHMQLYLHIVAPNAKLLILNGWLRNNEQRSAQSPAFRQGVKPTRRREVRTGPPRKFVSELSHSVGEYGAEWRSVPVLEGLKGYSRKLTGLELRTFGRSGSLSRKMTKFAEFAAATEGTSKPS
jgi:hypothetical protein